MELADFLAEEWRPALGCTEPACIAWAAASAAALAAGPVRSVHLVCDPRLYKNCFAVGIPHSGRQTGILWALGLGAHLPDPAARLECFRQITPAILAEAERLVAAGATTVQVDGGQTELFVDVRVVRGEGVGRAVVAGHHTGLVRLEHDGRPVPLPPGEGGPAAGLAREWAASLDPAGWLAAARTATAADRETLRRGTELNLAIARHGLSLFPRPFMDLIGLDQLTRLSRLVCAGVHARMCGEDFTVMTVAGSGNKGITISVPLVLWGREAGFGEERILEALAAAVVATAAVTRRLGSLSAACGCASAAGLGLAAGLIHLQGGEAAAVDLAVANLVGNVTGMICDGAKIGCGLKTMTAVDAAFRAASLAMSGVGIPFSDGIVGRDGRESLDHLERIVCRGMRGVDEEILRIMQSKLA